MAIIKHNVEACGSSDWLKLVLLLLILFLLRQNKSNIGKYVTALVIGFNLKELLEFSVL